MTLMTLIEKTAKKYETQYVKFIKYFDYEDDEKDKADLETFRYDAGLQTDVIKSAVSIYEGTARFAITVAYQNANQLATVITNLCGMWTDYFSGKLFEMDRFDWAVANQPANTIFFDTATKTFELIQFH